MGDRYWTDALCPYCGEITRDVYIAPTCGIRSYDCEGCKREVFIFLYRGAEKKAEEVTLEDLVQDFLEATSVDWDPEEVKRMCEEELKDIKERKSG